MTDTLGSAIAWTVIAPLGVMPDPDPAGDPGGEAMTVSLLMIAPVAMPANADLGLDVLTWRFWMPAGDVPDDVPPPEPDTEPLTWELDMPDGDVPDDGSALDALLADDQDGAEA